MSSIPEPQRRPYPSDVSDLQWRRIEPLLPRGHALGRPRGVDLREVVSAISYRLRTGCPWRMLPHDFPPWETVYVYHQRWRRAGLLPALYDLLRYGRRRFLDRSHADAERGEESIRTSTVDRRGMVGAERRWNWTE